MLKTVRQQAYATLVFLAAVAAIAWSIRGTPQKIATLMQDRHNASRNGAHSLEYWECRDGERDWDYICFVRSEPSALHASRGIKIKVQKRGVKVPGYYKIAGIVSAVLPDEGPILSEEELHAYRKENAARAEAAIKAKNGWSDEPTPRPSTPARDPFPFREIPFR